MSEIQRPEVEPVKILTIDEKPFAVDAMSEEVQKVIGVFDRWNLIEADKQHQVNVLADEISMIRAAKETVSRQILDMIKEEQKAAETVAENDQAPENTSNESGE